MSNRPLCCFGEFTVDIGRRSLRRGGAPVDLGDRAFSVLAALIASAGEIVDKSALLHAAWPDVTVGDNTLAQAVREIRTALGDDSSNPRFVQTVHRRGYRFLTPVQAIEVDPETASARSAALSRRRRKSRWTSLGAGAIAVAVVLGYLGHRSSPSPPFVEAKLRPLQELPDGVMKPSFSPAGDLMVAVVTDPESSVHSLWLVKPGAEAPLRLTSDIQVQGPSPVFTADGAAVLFTSYRNDRNLGIVPEVWQISVLGGQPRRVLEGASGACPSPDGVQLAFAAVTTSGTAITVRDPGGAEKELAEPGFWPRWSPDGRWIAFTTSNPEGGIGHVLVIRPDGSNQRQLTTRSSQVYGLCWASDSEWVIFGSDMDGASNLWAVPVDGGDPVRITHGPGESDSPAVSSDGRRLAFSYGLSKSAVFIAAAPGDPLVRIMSQEQVHALSLSPDGQRVAVILGGLSRGYSLSVFDLTSSSLRAVGELDARSVSWMPDGEALVVTAPSPDREAVWVWRVPLDGGLAEPMIRGVGHWEWPDVSPDGRRFAGSRVANGRSELVVVDLSSGDEKILDTAPEHIAVRWSPDSRRIAWSSPPRPVDSGSSGVWVLRLEDGMRLRLVPDGSWADWEPDGTHLIFARYGDNRGLWRTPLDGGPADRLYETDQTMWNYFIYGVDIARASPAMLVRLETATTALYALDEPPT